MIRIRPAMLRDLPGAYRVCALTAGAGDGLSEGSVEWSDPQIIGHVYTGPYFGLASDDAVGSDLSASSAVSSALAFVAVDRLGVAGYCLAAADTTQWATWCEEHWWPGLREDYPLEADYPVAEREIVELIHTPAVAQPEIVERFPAHLHIDLLNRARGSGLGRRLLERMLDALRDVGAAGVHLGVGGGNKNAIGFYRHLGFHVVTDGQDVTMALALDGSAPIT